MAFDRATKLEGLPHDKGKVIILEDEIIAYVPNRGAVVVYLTLDDKVALLRHAVMLVLEAAEYYINTVAERINESEKELDKLLERIQGGVFPYRVIAEEDTRILMRDIERTCKKLDRLYKALDEIGALKEHLEGIEIIINRAWHAMRDSEYIV